MIAGVAPHPDLGRLAELIGDWAGEGRGQWESGDVFGYRETLSITHSGKPVLGYVQRTTALDDGRPLHGESGYWRPAPDGGVELVLAHSVGAVGIAVGRWDGDVLRLRSSTVHTSPSAKRVTALERDIALHDDTMEYTLRMSTGEESPRWHLSAALQRSRGGP